MRRYLLAAAAMALCPSAVSATTVIDAVGDFAPGYTGAAADLDVTSFSVNYNAATQTFSLAATFAGAINTATAGFYIIGVNTGLGASAPFASLGAPNVRFDRTIRINKDGTTTGANGAAALIAGSGFSLDVSLAALPATVTGFEAARYGFNLWPREPTGVGNASILTDFAPNDGLIAAAPEPATWGMLILGFGLAGVSLRRMRRPAMAKRALAV